MKAKNVLLKIGINTALQTGGKIVTASLGFVSVMLLTRYLGPENYGNFSLIFAYLSFFAAFSDFGLQTTIINHLAQNKNRQKIVYNTFFWLKIALSVLSTIAAIASLFFFHYAPMVNNAMIIGAFAVLISDITGFTTTIFQSEIKLGLITTIDILTKIITVVTIAVLIILKLNFYYIIVAVAIGNIAGLMFGWFHTHKLISLSLAFDYKEAKRLIKTSFTIGITSFLSLTYFKLDTVMLSVMKGATDVGIYSLAYKIFENMLVLWWFYLASFYPLLAKFQGDKNYGKFKKLLINSIGVAASYAVGIIIFGYLFAPLLINIFSGAKFIQSILPLRILLFSSFFFFMTSLFYYYFFTKNKSHILLLAICASLIFNFVINLFIIPRFGYIGTSYTTVATEAFLMLIYIAIFYGTRKKVKPQE